MRKKSPLLALNFPRIFKGTLYLILSLSSFLSIISFNEKYPSQNFLGLFGYVIAFLLQYLLGLSCFLIPIFFMVIAFQLFKNKEFNIKLTSLWFSLATVSLSMTLVLVGDSFPSFAHFFQSTVYSAYFPKGESFDPTKLKVYLGGVPLYHLYKELPWINLYSLLGTLGTSFLSLFSFALSTFYLFDGNFTLIKQGYFLLKKFFQKKEKKEKKIVTKVVNVPQTEESLSRSHPLTLPKIIPQVIKPQKKEEPPPPPKKHQYPNYAFPDSSLLTSKKKIDASLLKNDLKKQASILEETLLSFGIEAKVGDIHSGPTITSFEVHPAVGVKVQKIKALENDIALNMEAKSIRIIAPIPGKAAVGIELPNPIPEEVSFREIFESYQSYSKKGKIPLLLGKAVNGDDIFADLTKMPHLLIAGATGSGKSVCINTIVMSIVMNTHPDEVKFLMVDPKKVELSAYTPLPHMMSPVITEADEARSALLYLVKEMEKRYELFRKLGHRNIESFNSRKPNLELEASLEEEVPKTLSYIVLIIDEFADLMMVSSADMETPIARIAQMARAIGIHMILATQRPSREVITGLIKANFPSRIAFKVASRINSQIILDDCGAESLLGNGDMLFMAPGGSNLARAQGAYIRDDDIHKVINFLKTQTSPVYLIPSFKDFKPTNDLDDDEEGGGDHLYNDAKKIVLETGNASTTFLQRKLKIGYARAASLMDELESKGIIGPQEGAKPRKIFYKEF